MAGPRVHCGLKGEVFLSPFQQLDAAQQEGSSPACMYPGPYCPKRESVSFPGLIFIRNPLLFRILQGNLCK